MKTYLLEKPSNRYYLIGSNQIEAIDTPNDEELRNIYLFGSSISVSAIPMPLKQDKQIIKALPFALEESLGSELDDTHIKYLSKQNGIAYSLILESSIIQELYDDKLNHSLAYLPSALPVSESSVSILLLNDTTCVKINKHYSYSIPKSLLEKSLYLELKDHTEKNSLTVYQLDEDAQSNELVIAQLQGLGLAITSGDLLEVTQLISSENPILNLLTGEYKRKADKKQTSLTKLKLPAYLIAASLLVGLTITTLETSMINKQTEGVQAASIEFYKKLFPGERVRPQLMKRQFNDTLKQTGSSNGSNLGFSGLLAKTALETKKLKDITFESIKYNSKNKSIELSLTCKSVAQLDKLKDQLTNKGLLVDIASANQSGSQVKGVLKVSHNG